MLRSLVGSEMCIRDRLESHKALASSLISLVQFPSPTASTRGGTALKTAQQMVTAADALPLAASAPAMLALVHRVEIQAHQTGILNRSTIELVDQMCTVFVQTWKRAKSAERIARHEADQLYKYKDKTHSLAEGEAAEEAELHGLFPEYGHVFADLEHADGDLGLESGDKAMDKNCLLYTSDAADEEDSVDLGGRRIIKKKNKRKAKIRDSIEE
eukprot:TRINITY_DN34813_c0_g1_i1.p1 TRINITY_DN34813_c0_g1~~TRINITY_DN34813_c0_g1_i1.p1  ORF type:complete len:251 (-),score=70.73 TRINITY_DN34813_c0_g1_i1:35-676(-)